MARLTPPQPEKKLSQDAADALTALAGGNPHPFHILDPRDRKAPRDQGLVMWNTWENPLSGWVITEAGRAWVERYRWALREEEKKRRGC